MDLHVPTTEAVRSLASMVGYITDGLDAVVVRHGRSTVYAGHVHLVLAGNARDLAIAVERAAKIGGKVD